MGLRNVSVNLCNVLSGRSQSLVMDLVLTNFRKCSNVYHACPFSVNQMNTSNKNTNSMLFNGFIILGSLLHEGLHAE